MYGKVTRYYPDRAMDLSWEKIIIHTSFTVLNYMVSRLTEGIMYISRHFVTTRAIIMQKA